MQGMTFDNVGAFLAVQKITEQWTAYVRHVNSYLVRSAGQRFKRYKCVSAVLRHAHGAVSGHGRSTVLAHNAHKYPGVGACYRSVYRSVLRVGNADSHGGIGLVYPAAFHFLKQTA